MKSASSRRLARRRGFTLIELLVVVLIIGILAAVALPKYQTAVLKSEAAASLPGLKAIAEAQARYFLVNGKYTASFGDLDIDVGINCAGDKCVGGKTEYYINEPDGYVVAYVNGSYANYPATLTLTLTFNENIGNSKTANLKNGTFTCIDRNKKEFKRVCDALGAYKEAAGVNITGKMWILK